MKTNNIKDILYHFYRMSYIPVSLYRDKTAEVCYAPIAMEQDPAELALRDAAAKGEPVSYRLFHGMFFGYVRDKDSGGSVFAGPVSEGEISFEEAARACRELGIPVNCAADLRNLVSRTSHMTLSRFLSALNLIGAVYGFPSIAVRQDSSSVPIKKVPDYPPMTEPAVYHDTEQVEKELLSAVQIGNTEMLLSMLFRLAKADYRFGEIQSIPSRTMKDLFVSSSAILSREAVKGGLDYDYALQLSDYYNSLAEQTDDNKIFPLLGTMMLDYTSRVGSLHEFAGAGSLVVEACSDVKYHLYTHLMVEDVAERLHVSTSNLSAVFRKETGMTLKSYIQKEKIEEAKRLLKLGTYSIADVSDRLCFSSVSHFQTVFRKLTGSTPGTYASGLSPSP